MQDVPKPTKSGSHHTRLSSSANWNKGDVTQLVPPKKRIMFCSKHPTKELDLYCETCEELVCRDCTVRIHRHHQYDLVTDAFQKHKDVLVTSLQPVEQQLDTVTKSLQQLDTQCQQITDQQEALVGNIHKTIRQLQEALEVRKTELIGELDEITALNSAVISSTCFTTGFFMHG